MSDRIKDLPVDPYYNPTIDEIKIIDSIFTKSKYNFNHTKLSIIICFIYIIFFLIFSKYKYPLTYYLPSTTLLLFISIYLSVIYII